MDSSTEFWHFAAELASAEMRFRFGRNELSDKS